eukprot:7921496-Alexandrium_andersonii.AAC.1
MRGEPEHSPSINSAQAQTKKRWCPGKRMRGRPPAWTGHVKASSWRLLAVIAGEVPEVKARENNE